jgi:hypothetical protein
MLLVHLEMIRNSDKMHSCTSLNCSNFLWLFYIPPDLTSKCIYFTYFLCIWFSYGSCNKYPLFIYCAQYYYMAVNTTNLVTKLTLIYVIFFFNLHSGGWNQGPLDTAATEWPIVSAPGDSDNGEIGGIIGRGKRSTRRKPAPVPLCPPQTAHAARTRSRVAAVGSQRLTSELRHGLNIRNY